MLYGDNRALVLGPLNVYYPQMIEHMNTAGVDKRSSRGAHNWSSPTEMSTDTHSHHLLQPKDYFKLPVPGHFGDYSPV
jgi:hypothetical protein